MIIDTDEFSEIKTNVEDSNTKELTIKQSEKIFSLLAEKLYSNQIGSIVRELSCNARDSHFEAENYEPFEITLPTRLNPIFTIRDYGVGMSEEKIDTVYSCLGETTKDKSNNLIGAYSLGSKTPIYYAKALNITSYQSGKKLVYSVYISGEGKPSITKMVDDVTEEKDGFEVMFAVQSNDFYKFEYEVKNQLKYFDFNYKVDDEIISAYKFENPIYEDDICVIYNQSYSVDVFVLFAGLYYEVKLPNFKCDIEECKIFLKFDIGDIDVSVSREDIQYTERTNNNIQNRLNEACDNYISEIKKYIDESKEETDFDLKNDFSKKYKDSWIFERIFNERMHDSKYILLEKYDKLRFYQFKKKIKSLRYTYYNPTKFVINNIDQKITAKKCFEFVSDINVLVLPITNLKKSEKIEFQRQVNQLIIDYDSKKFVTFFTTNDTKKIKDIVPKIKTSEIQYTELYYNGSFGYKDDLTDKYRLSNNWTYFVKYKNDLIDPETDEIIFSSIDRFIAYKICSFMKKRIFCFTKSEYKKLQNDVCFDSVQSGKDVAREELKYYYNNIDKYKFESDAKFNHSYEIKRNLNDINNIEDDLLLNKLIIKKNNKTLDYRLAEYLYKNEHSLWSGLTFNKKRCNINTILNDRYKFLNSLSYHVSDKDMYTEIVNLLYRRSIENEGQLHSYKRCDFIGNR